MRGTELAGLIIPVIWSIESPDGLDVNEPPKVITVGEAKEEFSVQNRFEL